MLPLNPRKMRPLGPRRPPRSHSPARPPRRPRVLFVAAAMALAGAVLFAPPWQLRLGAAVLLVLLILFAVFLSWGSGNARP
ncbi:hypothetical protein DQ384_05610 [Sphaerisporangium album]|uniref:Uncharacterized protein n=1 Tax=Sphaerisporangium album TaxID=509200 RepID=A0A367FQM9_9ACTN|nr:hypothetical protein [Sphaerisporangium album]RCG32017.1 hypothetical protein DQ384_05610 [Sphaerisporangium album]